MSIQDNIDTVQRRIIQAAERVDRDFSEIEIVAVSKTRPPEDIIEAVRCGIKRIGENKLQEADLKFSRIEDSELSFAKHMVGHLQTNKVRKAVGVFDVIESVDSLKLGRAISREAVKQEKWIDILIQVNTSAEETKFGVEPENTFELAKSIAELPGVRIKGLMTIGAFLPDPEAVRPCFALLRELSERISAANLPGVEMKYLSMGMTNDFEVAIEEGANLVRIGTAIFGTRGNN